ncbi:MAG: AAA family ATPase [Deltaproteobacteria bacterium]|nr:AAA family ATPase [Deltaproteobacteria bacterium]
MEALRHSAELALTGHGQMVAVIAEPGVGKSRLFHEFKLISQSEWITLEAFSVSHGKATAYLPMIDLLHAYFAIERGDDMRRRRENVAGKVVMLDRSLADTLPYLFALLGLSEGDDQLAQMGPEIRRRRMHEAIKRILQRESLNQPLMLIFEDLHWIDGETQGLLDLLVDSLATARILLLVNYRPEYRHEWSGRTYYAQLRLDPLGRENAQEMLSSLLGEQPGLVPLKRFIIERTEGNPFFMEETVRALVDDGALVSNGAMHLMKPVTELKIPSTVQAILAARIDRLPAAEKELLQTLAVIGREPSLELIKQVTGKSEGQLDPGLSNLQIGEFIYEQPSVEGTAYIFKHALTQQVAINSLLAERRRNIHEQAARAIEAIYVSQLADHYTDLAHHYLRSSDALKALRYTHLAAEQAVDRGAFPEAATMIKAALELLEQLPEESELLRSEFALRSIQIIVQRALYGMSSLETEPVIRRMCELGEKIGGREELLRGLIILSFLYLTRGEANRGLEVARRCVSLADSVQDARLRADAHLRAGLVALSCGKLREVVTHIEDAMRHAAEANPSLSTFGFSLKISSLTALARTRQLLGHSGEAIKLAEQALRQARESKRLFELGLALSVMEASLRCFRREPEILRLRTEEAITLSEQNGLAEWLHLGRFFHGWSLAELGQLEHGIAEMEAGIVGFRQIGGTADHQYAIALLACSYARIGRIVKALEILDECLARIELTAAKLTHSEILRLKGELLRMRDAGATEEAEICFRSALDVARAQEAKWWELRTSVSLARLLRDTNRSDEARSMLAGIYNWFTEGFELPDLKEAKALLDELRS